MKYNTYQAINKKEAAKNNSKQKNLKMNPK